MEASPSLIENTHFGSPTIIHSVSPREHQLQAQINSLVVSRNDL